jgi:phosphatidate cytidylyltransferase
MTDPAVPPDSPAPTGREQAAPAPRTSRAGRNLPAAVASAVVLLVAIAASLFFWKPGFLLLILVVVVVAVWELGQAFGTRGIRLVREPLMVGGVVMLSVAYVFGAGAMVTATAITVLAAMLLRLRGGIDGYVRDITATAFTAFYVPVLGGFVALLLAE